MSKGAICNGILKASRWVWYCPRCKRRRWATAYERYDSTIIKCWAGHTYITGDPDGLHYAGKFRPPGGRHD